MIPQVRYTTITGEHDAALARIIRRVMVQYGAPDSGTVLCDPSLDKLSDSFAGSGAQYFVAMIDGEVVGGAGINALENGPEAYCELQRMFLLPEARGKGVGRTLMEKCLEFATEAGYRFCYLETLPQMKEAIALYGKYGFEFIDGRIGQTGHSACQTFMLRPLKTTISPDNTGVLAEPDISS